MVLNKSKLLENGFLSFNLKDINESLYNELLSIVDKSEYEKIIENVRIDSTLRKNLTNDEIEKIINICNNHLKYVDVSKLFMIRTEQDLIQDKIDTIHQLHIFNSFVENKLNIEDLNNELANYIENYSQIWYWHTIKKNNTSYPQQDLLCNNSLDVSNKIFEFLLKDLYNVSYQPQHSVDLTLYLKNNFIENHQDGFDAGRLCVILIYLNDDYKEGYGGELVINKSNIVKPEFGNIVILDFTKNNVYHSVNSVLDDNFKRFAFIRFFYQ
jgi:Rps23 Pro-64 3,4-dihydroxylase Tpa1-like proline 4-hydroxylase